MSAKQKKGQMSAKYEPEQESGKQEHKRETASPAQIKFWQRLCSNRSRWTTSVQQFVLALYSGSGSDQNQRRSGITRAWIKARPGMGPSINAGCHSTQFQFFFVFFLKIHTFSRCSAWKPAGLLQTNRFSNYFKINSQSLEAGRARTHRWMLGRAPILLTRSAI